MVYLKPSLVLLWIFKKLQILHKIYKRDIGYLLTSRDTGYWWLLYKPHLFSCRQMNTLSFASGQLDLSANQRAAAMQAAENSAGFLGYVLCMAFPEVLGYAHFVSGNIGKYFKGTKLIFCEQGARKFWKLLIGNKETWPIIFREHGTPWVDLFSGVALHASKHNPSLPWLKKAFWYLLIGGFSRPKSIKRLWTAREGSG